MRLADIDCPPTCLSPGPEAQVLHSRVAGQAVQDGSQLLPADIRALQGDLTGGEEKGGEGRLQSPVLLRGEMGLGLV